MRKVGYALGLTCIAVIVSLFVVSNRSLFAQEDNYQGPRWDYMELSFDQPVTFGTNVSGGYYENGILRVPSQTPDITHGNLLNFYGRRGWELVSNQNNQVFIFKRPHTE